MSAIKSFNYALAWRRFIWTTVWAAMMALLVIMCIDLAANQPVIFGIVMLAAFVGSIGLAYTRVSWQNGATATAGAALIVSLLAIGTHTLLEGSYWSSVIDQINQEVISERAISDARAVVAEKRRERYAASSNGRSAAQIEAEIKASQTSQLWSRTASCTSVTAKDSRDFCQAYFQLQAKLAAAREAANLEGIVWSAGTTVEGATKRNLAAIAVTAANVFGGKPEEYTAYIIITLVAFTQVLLAFALPIGWAPEKRQEALPLPAGDPVSLEGTKFASPAVAAPVAPADHVRDVTEMVPEQIAEIAKCPPVTETVAVPEIGPNSPNSNPPKISDSSEVTTPNALSRNDYEAKTAAEVTTAEVEQKDSRPLESPALSPDFDDVIETAENVTKLFRDANPKASWKIGRDRSDVKTFFKEALGIDHEAKTAMLSAIHDRKPMDPKFARRLMDSPDVYDLYLIWYGEDDGGAVGPKPLSNQLGDFIGIPKGTRKLKGVKGIRNASGARFPVYSKVSQAERQYA